MSIRDLAYNIPDNHEIQRQVRDGTAFDTLAARINAEFKRVKMQYRRGLLNVNEAIDLTCTNDTMLYCFACTLGLRVDLSSRYSFGNSFGCFKDGDEQHVRFMADWEAWKTGAKEAPDVGAPWLYELYGNKSEPKEADMLNKHYFFRLLDILKIPLSCFDCCPNDIAVPRMRHVRTKGLGINVAVTDTPTDDGGLSIDDAPVGKSFKLSFSDGTELNIRISEARRSERNRNRVWYAGTGTFSGYTLNVEREINISVNHKEQVYDICFDMFNCIPYGGENDSDFYVYENHPLWERFREWQKQCAWHEEYKNALIDSLGSGK